MTPFLSNKSSVPNHHSPKLLFLLLILQIISPSRLEKVGEFSSAELSLLNSNNNATNNAELPLILSDDDEASKAPCKAGYGSTFSRQLYSFSVSKLTTQPVTPTQLAICTGLVVPCSGTLSAWRMTLVRQATVNKTILGVWRRESPVSARYILVGSTPLRDPEDDKAPFIFPGVLHLKLSKRERFYVRQGDYLGVHYTDDLQQPTVAYLNGSDTLHAGVNAAECLVLANKPKRSVLREISWMGGVTVFESDAVVEKRSYALTADVELSQIGERCEANCDCPLNANCITLSCSQRFCLCKNGYLPTRDGLACRPIVAPGSQCSPLETACTGELDIPQSAVCSPKTMRCECSPGYEVRSPVSNKCRPIVEQSSINNNQTTLIKTNYGLLGDDCVGEYDDVTDAKNKNKLIGPCWKSRGLECRKGKCACRSGFRPKSATEWSLYANSLDECVYSTETAVGCFTTKLTAKPAPTTPTTLPTTPKPECYSTYTCWLLAMRTKKDDDDDDDGKNLRVNQEKSTTTARYRTTVSMTRRIGENCESDSQCPTNARCYPFTCENFICTCKLSYTPSEDYRNCYKEIDLGGSCNQKNSSAVCRGSMLLAGSVSKCGGRRKCECASPYVNAADEKMSDRPGYCRMTMPQEPTSSPSPSPSPGNKAAAVPLRLYGRVNDACNENRTCYPSPTTVCLHGRCACAAGYREKLPLEYGYLPDRTSPCVSKTYQIGCAKVLSAAMASTTRTSTVNSSITTPTPNAAAASSVTAAPVPSTLTTQQQPVNVFAGAGGARKPGNVKKVDSPPMVTTLQGNDAATVRTTVRTTPLRTTAPPPTTTTTTPTFPKPATLATLSINGSGSMIIWLPIVVIVGVLAIVIGVIIYCCIFRPTLPGWLKRKRVPAFIGARVAAARKRNERRIAELQRQQSHQHHHQRHHGGHQHQNQRPHHHHHHHNNRHNYPLAESIVPQWNSAQPAPLPPYYKQ